MTYGLATVCNRCGEPMSEVYFLDNILGTKDSVVSCTDKECDYWECQPDENTMADYGLTPTGQHLPEKESRAAEYEEYQTARVEGFIPAEWEFEDYLLAEVKRLRERNDWLCWAIADITKSMNEDWRTWQRALKEMIE